jgi:hypothetical protein
LHTNNARDFIEDRDYDTFIDGDVPYTKPSKQVQNNSATATTYNSTNLYTKNNTTSSGENVNKTVNSCQLSLREHAVSDFGAYVAEAKKLPKFCPVKV